ncbi:hypothetical protein GJ744_004660 [Endocarpon pusillum]|uniref:Uncharacterized protein n=1 Tax=Endocarpon pusillum TaxID=364733 RepID=A0A8H7AQS0_9EURO|nr:hypothetical protein GJ744_004660 [Endocarpon pusillum]
MGEFMSHKGMSATECLHKGCPPPSNVFVKDFARWYYKSRQGQLDELPNNTSVRNTIKKFFGGFLRVTGTKIPDELRLDVYIVSSIV